MVICGAASQQAVSETAPCPLLPAPCLQASRVSGNGPRHASDWPSQLPTIGLHVGTKTHWWEGWTISIDLVTLSKPLPLLLGNPSRGHPVTQAPVPQADKSMQWSTQWLGWARGGTEGQRGQLWFQALGGGWRSEPREHDGSLSGLGRSSIGAEGPRPTIAPRGQRSTESVESTPGGGVDDKRRWRRRK